MKLLFVVDRVHAKDDPNINLVRGLLPQLLHVAQERHQDKPCPEAALPTGGRAQEVSACDIRFLGHTAQKKDADATCFYQGRDEAVRALYFSLGKLSAPKKMLRLACHPVNSMFGALKVMHVDLIAWAYRRWIEAVCNAWKPDAVIAVTAPFYTAKAVAAARVSCRKIIWMFDPYGTHYLMGGKTAQAQERRCLARVDQTFVPELIYKDYAKMPHVAPMAFPGLCEPQGKCRDLHSGTGGEHTAVCAQEEFAKRPIRLMFVGSLYADIRNPAPLLRLVRALGDRVRLTLVGGLYGEHTPAFRDEFDAWIAAHVTLVGKVDKQTAQQYLQQADVLVNIGNTVENQLPSKIFEYFSTGLPVLNFKQIPVCPADVFMQRYPLAYTINTAQPLTAQKLQEVSAFLQQSAGKCLPFAQVKALFFENTPEAVAQKLLAAARGE